MVKEVEFVNIIETLDKDQEYSNSEDQELLTADLTDEGLTLNVSVHVPLLPELLAQRKVILYFGNIDIDNKLVDYIKLEEKDFDFCLNGSEFTDKVYDFDLSRVLTIPRKVYSTGGTSEIIIELYTYESNVTTDYGSKSLSVPYTISSDSKYEYDKSTDGAYKLVVVDFEPWVATRTYGVGDIVSSGNSLIMSTVDDNSAEIKEASWSIPEDEDIMAYCGGSTNYPPLRAVVSNMLISRYAKYGIIRDIILSAGYKSYDNDEAFNTALLLQNLRTRAKFKLLAHKPVDAAYSLQLLKLMSAKMTDTTKIHTYNIKYIT